MLKKVIGRKSEAKKWYVVRCDTHGVKPKGQSYGEVKVPAGKPGSRMGSRATASCPICAALSKKEVN
jgi:hypothetical protein